MKFTTEFAEINQALERFDDIMHNTAPNSFSDIESVRLEFLGKKGMIAGLMQKLGGMGQEERPKFGMACNQLRDYIQVSLDTILSNVEARELEASIAKDAVDITLPYRSTSSGKLHPITEAINELLTIFGSMGFTAVEDREIEDEWYNFTALNIPKMHPARQMHDTFYTNLKAEGREEGNLLLRTHTSTVEIRKMLSHEPPLRIVSAGKVYRSDRDATHTPMFHQLEGLCVEEGVNMTQLKWCLEQFLFMFFGKEVPIRMRPSYFPFTEPSVEVDILCDRKGNEIKIGVGNDWLEVLGCGMTHPSVLKNVNIDPKKYQGFAFGLGVERLAMLKYGISDLRDMYHCDLRWLQAEA